MYTIKEGGFVQWHIRLTMVVYLAVLAKANVRLVLFLKEMASMKSMQILVSNVVLAQQHVLQDLSNFNSHYQNNRVVGKFFSLLPT